MHPKQSFYYLLSENELGHLVYSWGLQLSLCLLCLSFTLMLCWQGHCVVLYVYFCVSVSVPKDVEVTLAQTRQMNVYCHFARGLGESRYMPAESWSSLNKTLLEILDSYNEVNATLNLVLFDDAMAHVWVRAWELWEICGEV